MSTREPKRETRETLNRVDNPCLLRRDGQTKAKSFQTGSEFHPGTFCAFIGLKNGVFFKSVFPRSAFMRNKADLIQYGKHKRNRGNPAVSGACDRY